MYDFKFLLIFPQLIIVTLSNFENIGITQTGWIPSILSFILVIICFFDILSLVDLKDEEMKEFKPTGITLFILYILINVVYFGIMFYYRSNITNIEGVYAIIGLSVTQAFIFIYFLSNLFPPKNDSSQNKDQDLPQ
ncbi:hypothetical protein CVD28_02040 [Bacillus sp. M6-12]|uniref:hypothetical protein n=1 Tax=Bacillus sp. M6-12 TaxID=2054166 RepID=UPI000C770518|nr:hypothetical protein [Bacillus sp. M6-12]PLS19213.1 hypothetical protein CVD28_02040 [Bacillus sp. M6-12]